MARVETESKKRDNFCCGACYLTSLQKWLCFALIWLPLLALPVFVLVLILNAVFIQDPFVRQESNLRQLNLSQQQIKDQAERLAEGLKIITSDSENLCHVKEDGWD